MEHLVEVHCGEIFCDSQLVAQKFGYQHHHVVKVIQKLIVEFSKIKGMLQSTLNFKEIEKEYRGQKFKAFYMDRRTFSLLSMRFTGSKALEWQIKFNDAFYAMEKQLILASTNKQNVEWAEQRKQGKAIRLHTTDAIKDFIEYATSQGSENAKHYYKHVTIACYKCLNLIEAKKPKLRDTLDLIQSSFLAAAEVVAERSIRKHMAEGEYYKTIFTLVKQDLERFAEGLMIPEIMNKIK